MVDETDEEMPVDALIVLTSTLVGDDEMFDSIWFVEVVNWLDKRGGRIGWEWVDGSDKYKLGIEELEGIRSKEGVE